MTINISDIEGLEVYTDKGILLGTVTDTVIDMDTKKLEGIFVRETNSLLVPESRPVSVPYRWIKAIGDIVILRYFPMNLKFEPSKKETLKE